MRWLLLFASIMSTLIMTTLSLSKLVLEYEWKYADLVWESPQQKQRAIDSGAYNASSMFLFDVDLAPGRLFTRLFKDRTVILYRSMNIFQFTIASNVTRTSLLHISVCNFYCDKVVTLCNKYISSLIIINKMKFYL